MAQMTSLFWIAGALCIIVMALGVIGLCGMASDPYDEEECEDYLKAREM